MDSIALLQQWYLQQCNGDWEHSWGVRIETLERVMNFEVGTRHFQA